MTEPLSLAAAIQRTPAPFGDASSDNLADDLPDALVAATEGLSPKARALVARVAACSPYLRRLMTRDEALTRSVLETAPETTLAAAMDDVRAAPSLADGPLRLSALRKAKDKASLAIALADIAGVWDAMEAARRLSLFADAAADAALAMALSRRSGPQADPKTSGIAIIAMGKHGAYELNYSSDIDLIVVYDPERVADNPGEAKAIAVKATKEMVSALGSQTPDGYVFRTDLRLRPDPGVTAAALSVNAAESYYEAYGQNWERAAFIKARAAAGDVTVGKAFLKALRPFVWRKYLDYAAIEDVKSVKRQIHASKGGGDIEFFGHDVKIGRGGIREIEFYAQTQQLILGGKNPDLRPPATLDALAALCARGVISASAHDILARSYVFLRDVEHRLQMINDEQTHKLPPDEAGVARVAAFLGYDDARDFRRDVEETLRAVHNQFAALFDYEEGLASDAGSLVFTGVENHPETLETLAAMGFTRTGEVSETIRRWHASGVRATRSQRARELLTALTPTLLEALSAAGDADEAFFAFHAFLSGLPAGVQVFSLLANNPDVFNALIRIMTISPYLAKELSRRLNFVEQLLESRWAAPPPACDAYAPALAAALAAARASAEAHGGAYEAQLNAARRWAGEERFQITAQLAVGLLAPERAAAHYTAIADAAIGALAPIALEEVVAAHGAIEGGYAVLAFGRVGAGDMTAMSDVDLTFIYDAAEDAVSDGEKPLAAGQYFSRFVRRLITALSAATEEGALYEVDMQLRPSGRAGPTAVRYSAFCRYYAEEAWTWEKMALTKARIVAGEETLAAKTAEETRRILSRPMDRSALSADILDMRAKMLEAKPGRGPWDVKHAKGAMADVNFICQFLALTHGADLGPAPRRTTEALAFFAERGVLSETYAERLKERYVLYDAILQVSRAATGGVFDPASAGPALKERMAALCGARDIEAAEAGLVAAQSEVAEIYGNVIK
ncbi:MAG: bifunctional [glutamine synthetase] adenylyltransferase/[glutamine synthetase]-adenylyl-L-tyrosine phosphorylase [Pseudomonadota bacterium]